MNVIDIIVLVALIWGGYKGFFNGLISEGGTVLALILGIWASVSFSKSGGEFLAKQMSVGPQYQEIFAFAIIFLLVVIVCFFVTKLLVKFFEAIKLAWLDKLLGILFGACKYLIILAFLFFLIQVIVQRVYYKPVETFDKSMFFNPLTNSAQSLLEGSIIIPIPEAVKLKLRKE